MIPRGRGREGWVAVGVGEDSRPGETKTREKEEAGSVVVSRSGDKRREEEEGGTSREEEGEGRPEAGAPRPLHSMGTSSSASGSEPPPSSVSMAERSEGVIVGATVGAAAVPGRGWLSSNEEGDELEDGAVYVEGPPSPWSRTLTRGMCDEDDEVGSSPRRNDWSTVESSSFALLTSS